METSTTRFCQSHKKHDCKICKEFTLEKCLFPLDKKDIKCENSVDVIIIGSGTSGSVLANRLTEKGKDGKKIRVAVIEAGLDDVTDNRTNSNPNDPFPQLIRSGTASYYSGLIHSEYQFEHEAFIRNDNTVNGRIDPYYYSRGSTIGGSTSHHFGVHFSNTPENAQKWVDAGNDLWGFEQQIEALKKVTNKGQTDWNDQRYFNPDKPKGSLGSFDKKYDSDTGAIKVVICTYIMPLAAALGVSLQSGIFSGSNSYPIQIDLDYPKNKVGLGQQVLSNYDQFSPKFNDPKSLQFNPYLKYKVKLPPGVPPQAVFPNYPEDFGPLVGLTTRFMRSYAATDYYYPVRHRNNLIVLDNRIVTKILFEKDKDRLRAVGVEFWEAADQNGPLESSPRYIFQANRNLSKGFGPEFAVKEFDRLVKEKKIKLRHLYANVEVILSAGGIMSPAILMHSGIGPFEVLRKVLPENKLLLDIPGVGRGLKDHPEITAVVKSREPVYSVPYFFPPTPSVFTAIVFRHKVRTGATFVWQLFPYNISGSGTLVQGPNGPWSFYKGLDYREPGRVNPKWLPEQVRPTLQPTDLLKTNYYQVFGGIYDDIKADGFVEIINDNPLSPPLIISNHLDNQIDSDSFTQAFFEVIKPMIEQLQTNSNTYFVESAASQPINPNGTWSVPPQSVPGGAGYFDSWIEPPPSTWQIRPKMNINSLVNTVGNTFKITATVFPSSANVNLANGDSVYLSGITSPQNLNGYQLVQNVDLSSLPVVKFEVTPNYPVSGAIVLSTLAEVREEINTVGFIQQVKRTCEGHHASCTCRMGPIQDFTSVVDQYCRFYNVLALRVVDTSVAAVIYPAPTAPMAYMIGERAAKLITQQYEDLGLL